MPLWRWLFDEVLPNVVANWVADIFSPASMTGWATALAVIAWAVIRWHRQQRAAKKLGMASWPFIAVCLTIALLAVAAAAYGIGLKFSKSDLPSGESLSAIPQTQPFRLAPNGHYVIRTRDGATIPDDPRNADFQVYTAWLSVGNKPDPVQATLPPLYAARSPSDADKEIPIIDALSEIVRKELQPLTSNGGELLSNWQNAIDQSKSGAYLQSLSDFSRRFREANGSLSEAAQQIPQYCDDDLCVIAGFARRYDKITDLIDRARDTLSDLHKVIDSQKYNAERQRSKAPLVIGRAVEEPNLALSAYAVSLQWAKEQLSARRIELSKIASRR